MTPIPDFQTLMLPLLTYIGDTIEHSNSETTQHLATQFNLSEDQLKEMLPSNKQAIFYNRVAWAKAYLKMAGLIENTRRGYFKITLKGSEILKQKPAIINLKFLKEIPEYKAFVDNWKNSSATNDNIEESESIETQTPEEVLEVSYQNIRKALAQDLLSKIKSCHPHFLKI